jgi:hypothetical protein
MKETILRAILFPLTLFILIQPLISHKDYLVDLIVKANAAYAAEKAAPEGLVTPAIRDQVIDNLEKIGFADSEIEMVYDTTLKGRQQQLDVMIRIPRPPLFIYYFGTETQPQYYYARSYVMSEYLE